MPASNLLRKVVKVAGFLLLCTFCSFLSFAGYVYLNEKELDRQLLSLDQLFGTRRRPATSETNGENLLPEHIGSFRRSSIASSTRCGSNVTICLFTTYQTNSRNIVWLELHYRAGLTEDTLQYMSGNDPCGAELGGESILRTSSIPPYLYRVCNRFGDFLESVAWANTNWIIRVSGSYKNIYNFINNYPF